MSRGMKGLLAVCMVLAVLTGAALGGKMIRDWKTVRALEAELEESRARWEETVARKEALQAELKTVQEALREAQLTYEESVGRAEELREDIRQLEEEIALLSGSD